MCVCLEAAFFVFVSFLGKVAGKVAVWIGNWVTNKEELVLLLVGAFVLVAEG